MRHIVTTTRIDAPPELVWSVLVDFAAYPQWNPFMHRVEGRAAVGQRLSIAMQPLGGKSMTMRPRIEIADGAVLQWIGRLVIPGLFDGRHRFELSADGAATRLEQSELFRGVVVALAGKTLDQTARSFEAVNSALRLRAELIATSS